MHNGLYYRSKNGDRSSKYLFILFIFCKKKNKLYFTKVGEYLFSNTYQIY